MALRAVADFLLHLLRTGYVKVFGCRPSENGQHARGRRPKTSKGGNRERLGQVVRRARPTGILERRANSSWAILNGRRHRIRAQLRRYGTDIAIWGFHLSRLM